MLIALLIGAFAAMLAATAGSSDMFDRMLRDWRRALRRHVDDRARREAGLAALDELERDAAVLVAELRAWMCAFGRVHREHGSTAADYDPLADALVEQVYAAQLRVLDRVEQLRQTIGDAAWRAITDDVARGLGKARERQERREGQQRVGRCR